MIRDIVIGPGAKADIREIWRYTNCTHGSGAADAYVRDLDQAMQLVREFPHLGTDCANIREGYRRIRSGSHLIYYISSKSGIYIVRILHDRRDAQTNLR